MLNLQVSNYFAPSDKAKQEGFNAYLTDKNAERLATALCRMRGAALKLGQMLSIQDEGVLPPQVSLTAFMLQNKLEGLFYTFCSFSILSNQADASSVTAMYCSVITTLSSFFRG